MLFKYSLKRVPVAQRVSLSTQWRIAWVFLLLIMAIYAFRIGDQAVLRYTTFQADAFDLGNMDQAIWNTLHGRPFQFTNQGSDNYGPPTRLATHVEPIIFLLSLLYLFHADARILLIFQTLVLVAGALPVFLLARKLLPRLPLLAFIMAAAYLASPALLGLNLYDFHPVSLATPLLLYAVLALEYRRYGWFLLACLLACACKEDVPLAVAMLGVLILWKYRLPRLGILLIVAGFLWSALAFFVIMPHFFPGEQHNNYWYRYAATLGSTPSAAVVNLLLHPWLLFTLFISLDRVYYLASLLRSSGFLALLAPEWLLPTLPSLAVNMLANGDAYHSGVYQYNAAIIPFVMIAAVHGMRRLIMLWSYWRGEPAEMVQSEPVHASGLSRFALPVPDWLSGALILSRLKRVAHVFVMWPIVQSLCVRFAVLSQWSRRQWQHVSARMSDLAILVPISTFQWSIAGWIVVMFVLNYSIMMPWLSAFWPDHQPGLREQRIEQLLTLIPPDASVSASGNINPHLTERRYVTVFPEITLATADAGISHTVKYVIVDLDDLSPEDKTRSANYVKVLNQLQRSHQFHQLAQVDGVVVLVRDHP